LIGPAAAALLGAAGAVLSAAVAATAAIAVNETLIALVVVAYATVGLVILARHPGHRVGRLMTLGAMIWGLSEGVLALSENAVRDGSHSSVAALGVVVGTTGRGFGWLLLVVVLPQIFPDGDPVDSPRLRRLGRVGTVLSLGVLTVVSLFSPSPIDTRLHGVTNPIGVPPALTGLFDFLGLLNLLAVGFAIGVAVACFVHRWRRADELMRQQLAWFGIAFALPVVPIVWTAGGNAPPWLFGISTLPLPVAVGVAVLQRRLYDVQLAVNRSITYGALSVAIAGLYAVVVGGVEVDCEDLPLTAYGVGVGALRWSRQRLRPTDRELLKDVANQLGGVVHAASLLDVIRDAQERLVLAREEERKRLRRDLHDGLGPALAALTLQVDTLRNQAAAPDLDLDAELLRLRGGIQGTVLDVRRIVEGLRPPALDELGLEGALGQLAARLAHGSGLTVAVDVPALPRIPAAVEVAAYRVTQEALTNVVKHASAQQVCVRVSLTADGLCLEVTDDGTGHVQPRSGGVGLDSMRERAEEIGGTLRIENGQPRGATVRAWLPVGGVS
jgi:signal transduction histidine kinase